MIIMMKMAEKAEILANELSDKKAHEVVVIDISEKSSFADRFVNATAGSERQLGALRDFVEERAESMGLIPKNIEGKAGNSWILMDYGDIIVNIFTPEAREKYSLDKVWGDCDIERIN